MAQENKLSEELYSIFEDEIESVSGTSSGTQTVTLPPAPRIMGMPTIKMPKAVRKAPLQYTLDAEPMEAVKYEWSGKWATVTQAKEEERGEIVEGCDLREGDYLMYQMDSRNSEIRDSRFSAEIGRTSSGLIGWFDGDTYQHNVGFSKGHFFEVRSPRPAPLVNEFGPVSP